MINYDTQIGEEGGFHLFYAGHKAQGKPAMVAKWSKALSQVDIMPKVPGSNPAWDYNIDCSRLEHLST